MGAYFLESSALAKRYVAEVGSAWVRSLTDLSSGNDCWIAAIARVELLSALYRRARLGDLSLDQARGAEMTFRHELSSHFHVVVVDGDLLDRAMSLVAAHPLRAYDAVQLAAAIQVHLHQLPFGLPAPILVSSDDELNQAAAREGMAVDDPNLHP